MPWLLLVADPVALSWTLVALSLLDVAKWSRTVLSSVVMRGWCRVSVLYSACSFLLLPLSLPSPVLVLLARAPRSSWPAWSRA